jgi:hypothetical protein
VDKAKVEEHLFNAQREIDRALLELGKPDVPPDITDCAKFEEALVAGGPIKIAPEVACSTPTYFNVKGGTDIQGALTRLHGNTYGIRVKSDQHNGSLRDLLVSTIGQDCVINLGVNDTTQNQLSQVPTGWFLELIKIKDYSGKRGIAVNSANTRIKGSDIVGVIHPNNQDSQAICILNSPGDFIAEVCTLSAASECVLIGGDSPKLPVLRRNIAFIRCNLFKDIAWRTAGIPVKNLFEAKDGWGVLLDACRLSTCWASAQQGEAYMLTPSNGGQVSIIIRNNEVWDVSSICNITGVDRSLINMVRTQVTFEGGTFRTNKAAMGGRGNFALMDRGPEFLKIYGADIAIDGSTLIELTGSAKMDLLEITGSRFNYGQYGIRIGGLNDGDNSKGMIGTIKIEGNTILGANSRFQARYPNNIYA